MEKQELIAIPFNPYDKETEYLEHVHPIVLQLVEECKRLGLPVVVACSVRLHANGNCAIAATRYFNGLKTTPVDLFAVEKVIRGELDEACELILADDARRKAQAEPKEAFSSADSFSATKH